ncbi:MAG: YncE family protein [Thaumarchaeota archaeon]|nr:YncE family protein [Nitrososphaerota archaeon]
MTNNLIIASKYLIIAVFSLFFVLVAIPSPLISFAVSPQVHTSIKVGDSPQFVVFDTANQIVYVANSGTTAPNGGTVSIINGAHLITTIGRPAFRSNAVLTGLAYDPINKMIYVSDLSNHAVYVISGTKVVSIIQDPKLKCPGEIGFDPANSFIIVSNNCELANTNTVSVISGIHVLRQVQMSSARISTPLGIAFAGNNIFVANLQQNNVSVIDGITFKMIKSISVGSEPSGLALDPTNSRIYVTNFGSNDVTVINAKTLKVLSTILVGSHPEGIAFSPTSGQIYVTNSGSNTVSIINNLSVFSTAKAGTAPSGLAFSSKNNMMYVADSTNPGFVTLIS